MRKRNEMDLLHPRAIAILRLMSALALAAAELALDPEMAIRGLLGGARVATVRLRVKAAEAICCVDELLRAHSKQVLCGLRLSSLQS